MELLGEQLRDHYGVFLTQAALERCIAELRQSSFNENTQELQRESGLMVEQLLGHVVCVSLTPEFRSGQNIYFYLQLDLYLCP